MPPKATTTKVTQLTLRSRRKPGKLIISRYCSGLLLFSILLPGTWIAYRQVQSFVIKPKAILVLGGATQREQFAAEFAQQHPDLPIWVSSGDWPSSTQTTFTNAGVALDRLQLDRRAVDTVTNFTTLVDEFQAQGINHVYLVTSDYHMQRAQVVGEIVFGSRGILLKPVTVPSEQPSEPILKVLRDAGRSVLWLLTGHTGSTLRDRYQNPR